MGGVVPPAAVPEDSQFDHLVGIWSELRSAPYPVSIDSIRRFVQAAMISDDIYGSEDEAVVTRFGGVVAPPLFPVNAFVRPLKTVDPLDRLADEPDWDASSVPESNDLPRLESPLTKTLNGGTEARIFRLARVGDRIGCQVSYLDIRTREGRSGPLLLVRVQARYVDQEGNDLLRTVRTMIRR